MAASAAQATTIVLPSDEQLVQKSPVIVAGTVLATEPIDRAGTIWTDTTIAVTRWIKGRTDATLTVREVGGVTGDRITRIFGAPEFAPGEHVLLFLERSPSGGYRVMDLFVGKFSEARALDGRRLWLRHDGDEDVTLLDAQLRRAASANVQRDADGFETFLAERVAGRPAKTTYGIENPVVMQGAPFRPKIRPDFTLMSDPNVVRWFLFDQNQSAPWYHSGTQPGYNGGGLSELQTAMAAWTSYGEAKIRYAYSGTLSVPAKGTGAPNGVNEVLFNDPLAEIAGSWNPSTGGTVGLGGYNGVAGGKNFTATFQADPTHPAGSIFAWEITEANLVIQDGVSPLKGVSSSRLAEIIAHEFGHTLGIGHSDQSDALMYYAVTGLGPSLRADDRTAARWLYPNGGGTTPPPAAPAAPSSLTVTTGADSADLAWKDNATDETSQSVYLAIGNGSFANVGSVAANVTSARLSSLATGQYRAYVVASNGAGTSAPSNTAVFEIGGPPVAAFAITPGTGTAAVTSFTFTDQSSGAVSSRLWQFGDGSTSTASVATHTYAKSGQYTVTLTVSGPRGSAATSKVLTVSGPLNPQFSWSPSLPAPNETVQFVDESGGAPVSWLWSFGDGTTSTSQSPAKKYGAAGTYIVTLTVQRSGASASVSQNVTIAHSTPGTQPPVAAFDASATGTTVSFLDRSSGGPTSWQWSFGDGTTSAERNPTHAYAAEGTYLVTLTAANAVGSSTQARQILVSSVAPYRALVSAVAQTVGMAGTSWRTELSLFNAGADTARVTLRFLPGLDEKSLELAPRQSVTYANTLLDAFGLANGAGAVAIEGASGAQVRVTSRTFTPGSIGVYGQGVPAVEPQQLGRTLYITGIQSSEKVRTNIGLVNRAGAPLPVTLTIYSRTGETIGTRDLLLTASSFRQSGVRVFFPELQGASHDALTLKITTTASDAVSAYASVIDNVTQDPVYIQAMAAPAGASLTIPAVTRSLGANGTYWRSDVTLFNPSDDAVSVTLRYGSATRSVVVGGRGTEVLADILSMFRLTAGGGALEVSWSGGTGPVVTSRTYTTADGGGTFGQSIAPIGSLERVLSVPGLRNDEASRTNVGFVNGGDEAETFAVLLLSPSGEELGRTTLTLVAKAQAQHSVSSLFPEVTSHAFTVFVEGDENARLFAYGSMVDNASGDPVFFAGR